MADIDHALAIDLGEKPARTSAEEQALIDLAAGRRQAKITEAYAQSWDRSMQRAFKGIITRAERRRMLKAATR